MGTQTLEREGKEGAQAPNPMSSQVFCAPASTAVPEDTLKLSEMLVRTGSKITRNHRRGLHNSTVSDISASNMMRSSASEEISLAWMNFPPVTLQISTNSTIRMRFAWANYLRNPVLLTSSGTTIDLVIRHQVGSNFSLTEQTLLRRTKKNCANK